MSIEHRLTDALRTVDGLEPSPDLFARTGSSLEEDMAARRRRLRIAIAVSVLIGGISAWVVASASETVTGQWRIVGWRLTLAYLVAAGSVIVLLAPNIRRFGQGFVEEVFHLSPRTGRHFTAALDVSYYALFTGIALVDADVWQLGETVRLAPLAESYTSRLASLLLVMGVLHAFNIALLPALGLIFNSIARTAARQEAGAKAPNESWRARKADAAAHAFAVGLAVLAISVLVSIFVGGPGAFVLRGG